MKKIGIIADTHGYVDPEVSNIFEGVDLILHAGDVGDAKVIEELEKISPVIAISGNHEDDETAKLDWIKTVEVGEIKIALTHRFFPLTMQDIVPMPDGWQHTMGVDNVRVMVFGHSHEPFTSDDGKIMYYNSGYSGPDMTEPLRTVGIITVEGKNVEAITYFLSKPPRTEYLEKVAFHNNFSDKMKNTG